MLSGKSNTVLVAKGLNPIVYVCVCVWSQDKKGQELPNVVELEIANMDKLVHQQREPEKNTV